MPTCAIKRLSMQPSSSIAQLYQTPLGFQAIAIKNKSKLQQAISLLKS
jgi:hypothetical protein